MTVPEPRQLGFELDGGSVDESTSDVVDQVVRVRPDVVGIDKCFDYSVGRDTQVEVGDLVHVVLGGRRVGGWVTATDVTPVDGHRLVPLSRVSGRGPTQELVELADWAAWRWAGRPVHFLRAASPDANVERIPAPARLRIERNRRSTNSPTSGEVLREALATPRAVLRWPPGADRYAIVREAVDATGDGWPLILLPSARDAATLARRLRSDGNRVALLAGGSGAVAAGEWASARAGAVVVGTRGAAWAPLPKVGRVVVLDEDDEAYQGERTPTWHARDVVIERARRSDAACLLVSATPSLEALTWGRVLDVGPGERRSGWPRVQVVDQRDLDPATGPLFSPALVELVRGPGRILCVLNRTGRVRQLASASCRSLARCADCDAAVSTVVDGDGTEKFVCGRDAAHVRPMLCLECGSTAFRNLRLGVGRAREELEVLAGEPVGEVTAEGAAPDPSTRILLGTEAVLHRYDKAAGVAFLDLDQHLMAVRYRASEQALSLVARAARIASRGAGRLLIQTRNPDHPVVVAAVKRDPALFSDRELKLRTELGLPPTVALARVSGPGAEAFVEALPAAAGLRVQGPLEGIWRIRAQDHVTLCDALRETTRPAERLRVEVDPLGA